MGPRIGSREVGSKKLPEKAATQVAQLSASQGQTGQDTGP